MNSDSDVSGGGRSDRDVDRSLPVLLTTVFDPVEAEIIVAKLRSAGIEAMVRHDALSVVYGLTVDGCGQQDILVRPGDLEEARAALEPAPEEPRQPSPRDDAGPPEERTS
jgi:hypothetical protein